MKKIHLLILLCILTFNLFAQKWSKTFGNPSWYEGPRDITESYDEGYFILGNTGYNHHGWLIKTDINGELLWDIYFGGTDQTPILEAVEQDVYGNLYLAGLMKFGMAIPASIVIKLNSCGELQWCKTIYTENLDYNYIKDMLIYNDSTLICYAYHNEPDDENNNYLYNINSITGDLRWKKPYASKSNYPLIDQSSCVRLYSYDDWLLLAGDCYSAYPNGDSNHFYLHPFFIGMDANFKEKWVLQFGLSDSLLGTAWGAIPVSDSVIMGYGKRRLGSFSDPLLMFFDSNGNELGYKTIDNDLIVPDIVINQINDMQWINDTLLFASLAYSVDEIDMNFCDIQTDTSGYVHKVVLVDPNAGGGGKSNMLKTFDDKYVVTTGYIVNGMGDIYLYKKNSNLEQDTIYAGNYTYDSLCEEPITSGNISLGGCDVITNVKDVPTLEEYNQNKKRIFITAFPNPSNGTQVTLEFQNTAYHQNMELRCYNIFGSLVHQEKIYPNQGESKVDVGNWQPGMYIALFYSQGQILGKAKFLVK